MKSLTIGFDGVNIYCCIDIGAYETKTIYATTNSEELITDYIEYWEIATRLSDEGYKDIDKLEIGDLVLTHNKEFKENNAWFHPCFNGLVF